MNLFAKTSKTHKQLLELLESISSELLEFSTTPCFVTREGQELKPLIRFHETEIYCFDISTNKQPSTLLIAVSSVQCIDCLFKVRAVLDLAEAQIIQANSTVCTIHEISFTLAEIPLPAKAANN